jgi:hypothetical protein
MPLRTQNLKILNACRIYLQVLRTFDITSADGSRIRMTILNGEATSEYMHKTRKPHLNWPTQTRPDKASCILWRQALLITICNPTGLLKQQLGKWNYNLEPNWKYFHSMSDNCLYEKKTNSLIRYQPQRIRLVSRFSLNGTVHKVPPDDIYPALPIKHNNYFVRHHSISSRSKKTATSTVLFYLP